MCENESEMEKNHTKDKIEPEHINTDLKRVTEILITLINL